MHATPRPVPAPLRASEPPPGLSFRVLGPLRVRIGEVETDVRPPLAAALLTTLLLRHGRRGGTQALIDDVWGDGAPGGAPGALRGHVAALRRVVEPGRAPRTPARVLVSRPNGYALHLPPDALDLTVFDRRAGSAARAVSAGRPGDALALYDSALGLWDGEEPLAGVPGPFAAAQRSALRERRLAVLEDRWEVVLLLGGHARAVEELRGPAQTHPRRARLQELLMTALYETGRQTEALDVHARAHGALRGADGPGAGAGLDRIRRRILAGPGAADEAAPPGPVNGPGSTEHPPSTDAESPPTKPGRGTVRSAPSAAAPPAPTASPAPPPAPTAVMSPTLGLPPDTADLVGRDAEVVRLRQVLEGGSAAALGAISGMGGVGKTALAVRVAHEVAASFPDGVFFVDLCGMDARPADPHEVLGDLLRALGVTPAQLPAETAERVALHRSLLSDRRVLVVLDNAHDLRQIRDLVPTAPGCGLLVTSRTWLTGFGNLGGATLVHLDELTDGVAVDLLVRLVGEQRVRREEEAARALVADCGRLPLAIRVVAARMAGCPELSVAETARRLADERRRPAGLGGDSAVEATFRLGTARLAPEQLRAFRLLALPDLPELGGLSAAALLDRPRGEAEALCEGLVDAGLLQSPAPGRYRYHDLLRLFARTSGAEELPAAERGAAMRRLLDTCTDLAREAYRSATAGDPFPADDAPATEPDAPSRAAAVGPGSGLDADRRFASPARATTWLFDERLHLLALVEQAAGFPEVPAAVCAHLLLATDPLGRDSTGTRNLERAARAVLAAAERSDDAVAGGIAHFMLGGSFAIRFAMGRALPHLRTAADVFRREERWPLLAHALNALGGCALAQRDFPTAVRHLTEALPLSREPRSPACESVTLGFLGLAQLATGRAEEAVRSGRAAVAQARSCGDGPGEANALRSLGQVLLYTGQRHEALDCMRTSLRLWRTTGSTFREALVLGGLAEAFNLLGRYEEAVAHATEARDVATLHGDTYLLGRALVQLADAVAGLGRAGQATYYRRQALRLFRELGMPEAADVEARLDAE
ncbi:tetratricopeptide repeat protein [Streptomyces sp. DK15]|uniref:AfsR/SARP family transcriptional regulator n=1 Tax=Streptomyces sp. DK15 TaxID=2957499 RepID=UPI0029AC5181|nr:BTAD domain-containing putative transcriptional regulator [Streptomyces sp. DK15]MDX2391457.1 tetratricopeptide repeat protein [Streptomyces sp. DK15]